jgi:ATP-binding cassette subfamily F protein 3
MPILACTNLKHSYGDRVILDGCSMSIESSDRIGVVGRNGAGKSTFLKALAGIMKVDSGEISLQRGARAGYLHQDPILNPEETLRGEAESAFADLHRLHQELDRLFALAEHVTDDAELERLLKKQAEVEQQMQTAGGYAIDHKIAEVLHGLGFSDAQFSIPVRALSGGQKGRLALAKLLLESPDVILLDEPTNHLDIDGRLWLERFLRDTYKGAVIVISHDRALLDNVVGRIVEVEAGRLIEYPGNYADFRELRAERRMVMARAYDSQQSKFRKQEEYIRRFKAGQRARQAKGRETRLNREKRDELLERPMELDVLDIELPKAERSGDMIVSAREISKSYPTDDGGRKVLFRELDISITRGERWGIIGPNGAGKSTIVRCMLGELAVDAGTLRLGSTLQVGYYRQMQDGIDLEQPVFRYLQGVILREAPSQAFSEQKARDLAGAFLFTGPEQERLMRECSGGERSRAVLAGLLASAKNVLVLDEPTNHLDISASERLEQALLPVDAGGTFDGTLILISHDRELIENTCDHILFLDGDGNAEVFAGTYSEWREKYDRRMAEQQRSQSESRQKREDSDRRRREKEESKAPAPPPPPPKPKSFSVNALARLTVEQIESKIEELQSKIRLVDEAMADPEAWSSKSKMKKLEDFRASLAGELEPLEFEWSRRAGDL